MDTITQVHHGVIHIIQDDLDPTHWALLFFGLIMYWLKSLNAARMAAQGKPFVADFWKDNWIEMPTSILSCVVLAMMAKNISTDLIDLHGTVTTFVVGYFSSSILNAVITQYKPAALKTINAPSVVVAPVVAVVPVETK